MNTQIISMITFCCNIAVHTQHSSSPSPIRDRDQSRHPRQVHLCGQDRQDDPRPGQAGHGQAPAGHRGPGGDQSDQTDPTVDEVSHGELGGRHQGPHREQHRQRAGHWPGWHTRGMFYLHKVFVSYLYTISISP